MTNPDELPGQYPYKSTFQKLHVTYKTSLSTTVECVVYQEDEREIAEIWVGLEHTGENQGVGTVTWTTRQKERFDNRRNKKLSRAFQVLEFLDTKKVDTSDVKQTNLDRLLSTPAVLEQLGIDFPGGQLVLTDPEHQVIERLKKVIGHIGASGFSVRQIYHADQRVEWIGKVLAPTSPTPQPSPITHTPSSASSNSNTASPAPAPSPNPNPVPAVPPSVNTNTSQTTTVSGSITNTSAPPPSPTSVPAPANPSSYTTLINHMNPLPATSSTKVVEIYKELQTVNVTGQRQAPHAVAALLRILIEIAAQEYLIKKQSFRLDGNNVFRNPAEHGKAYDRLDEKLNYIANRCNLPGNIANALRVLVHDQLITTTLNQVMHNTIFRANSTTIKDLWQNFEKVFDHLIDEMK